MVRTLFAHWHKDALYYEGGSISSYVYTFLLNQTSRIIGFCIRILVLGMWLAISVSLVFISAAAIIFFLLAPVLLVVAVASSVFYILSY